MSRFTEEDAFRIAKKAIKKRVGKRELRSRAPLLGKEAEVLRALIAAETAHDALQQALAEERKNEQSLADSLEQHEIFLGHIKVAVNYWRGMSEAARFDLIHFRPQDLPMGEWASRSIPQELETFEANLYEIERAAQGTIILEKGQTRGRRPGKSQSGVISDVDLDPLVAFAAKLKTFWENEAKESFGQRFIGSDAISAAANFLNEAVKAFKIYTPANVQTVMKELQKEHEHPSSYYEGLNCLVDPDRR
jgi:hypothetical protein